MVYRLPLHVGPLTVNRWHRCPPRFTKLCNQFSLSFPQKRLSKFPASQLGVRNQQLAIRCALSRCKTPLFGGICLTKSKTVFAPFGSVSIQTPSFSNR